MDLSELLNSSSSSSSSSDTDDCLDVIPKIIAIEQLQASAKNKKYVEETVPLYSEAQFITHFRLCRKIVEKIALDFEMSPYFPKKDTGFQRISPFKSVLAFLWFASNEAACFRDVGDRFDISVSTLHSIVENVTMFLSNLSNEIIVWPSFEERRQISEEFSDIGFPGAVGCIDGTHIRIDTPKEDPDSYLNRKKYHSIQVQVVCDNRKKIRDVFIGYPGSVHDARVFRNSDLFDTLPEKCQNYFILGDSAYPCLRNLLTPYKDSGNLGNIERNYNKKLSHCRILVEHTIGLLKQRFRQLYHIKSRNISFICHFIRGCCVLHNMCIDNGIILEILEDYEEGNVYFEIPENEEVNEVGNNYRNYVAATLNL